MARPTKATPRPNPKARQCLMEQTMEATSGIENGEKRPPSTRHNGIGSLIMIEPQHVKQLMCKKRLPR